MGRQPSQKQKKAFAWIRTKGHFTEFLNSKRSVLKFARAKGWKE